ALTFQNHTDCPLTDFGGKTSIFSHPVYLFLRKFSLQDSRGGSLRVFFLNFENTKYRDVSLGDELSSGNDLPTEKVSQTTLQIIPERLCG
ncbi:hypothetical protein J4V05_17525, partial [Escherichia coli]